MTNMWYNIFREKVILVKEEIMNSFSIGERIKELREQAKLRQNQVAAYLGVDQSYLSKIESGERCISVDQLERLAELYGCSLDTFNDPSLSVKPIQISLRVRELTVDDMNIIATINHIASNSKYMAKMIKGES